MIDPNSKELRYIGLAKDLQGRIYGHYKPSNLKKNTHKNNWVKSLLFNKQEPEIVILEQYNSEAELPQAEADMIAYYRFIGADLTNATDGGEGMSGYRHTEEEKKRRSEANKGRVKTPEECANISASKMGEQNPMYGKQLSDERKKQSSMPGESNPFFNKKHTDETKAKMREAKLGGHLTEQAKTKLSDHFTGRSWKMVDGKRKWMDK
jgi:group I intron endonuclease